MYKAPFRPINARHEANYKMTKTATKICILGSGNVATHLAQAVNHTGYTISAIYSRTMAHAIELARKTGCNYATDCYDKLPDADIYIISVKDDVIKEVCSSVAALHPGKLYIHTAGSVPLSVISDVTEYTAVLYPLQTFSKGHELNFSEVPLFIEASNSKALDTVSRLANNISNNVKQLDSSGRRKLHLSAVFACNFANHCFALAYRLLQDAHIDPSCLYPLIHQTVEKLQTLEPVKAQTGPAARWDTKVIKAQTEALANYPELQEVYKIMSESIHRFHD